MRLRFFVTAILPALFLAMTNPSYSFGQLGNVEELLSIVREDSINLENERIKKLRCRLGSRPLGGLWNTPIMQGNDFRKAKDDLPFIAENELQRRYSYFWVNTDVLNIRSGPNYENKIISETYFGNQVTAFAKTGDWVAIGVGYKSKHTELRPRWVHLNYLSSLPIREQVDTKVLKKKCSFNRYAQLDINELYSHPRDTYRPCVAVLGYLRELRDSTGSPHAYWDKYENWRNTQLLPDSYNYPSC